MEQFDEILYEETRHNLISAAHGNEELIELVEFQLEDMKECGFFDVDGWEDYYEEDEYGEEE